MFWDKIKNLGKQPLRSGKLGGRILHTLSLKDCWLLMSYINFLDNMFNANTVPIFHICRKSP